LKLLFVYGTLKKGFLLNPWLNKGKYLQDIEVQGFTLYAIKSHPLYSYPYIVPSKFQDKVQGEIWEVSENTFESISNMEIRAGYTLFVSKSDFGDVYFYGMKEVLVGTKHLGSIFTTDMQ